MAPQQISASTFDVPPLRILFLEDNADDAELVARELQQAGVAYVPERVDSAAAFAAGLNPPPELILADYRLPGYDALTALRTLRERGIEVPVIVISGTVGEEAAVECLREGATDYLLRDRLGRLGQAVRNAVEQARLREAQRRTAAALQASEERYRTLVEGAPFAIWVADGETLRFLEVNRQAIEHYGYSREEFLAMSLLDIRPPEEIAPSLEGVRKVLAGEPNAGRSRHITKAGRVLEVSGAGRLVSFDGRPALLAMVDDVTERLALEAQLRQSQKMEAMGHLAGGIAHDFNNLLTAILGFSGLMTARAGGRPDLLGPAEEIRKAAERAAELTRQLLAFSRRQALHPQVVDLNEVVSGIETMLRRLIGEQVTIAVSLQAAACPVLVDRGQLEQVIVNLAVNARDAMPDGGRLAIETACVELAGPGGGAGAGAGPHVMLAVRDTGCGMDAETRSHIFEPFFTTKEPGKGTGLGLATVYGIVHQSGGHLEVASEPRCGSTFKILFPRAGRAAERSAAPATQAAAGGLETVLVLEDDPPLNLLVRTMLEDRGYTVLVAETAAAAIDLAERHPGPIHLVLADIVMPGMSGPEAAARLVALRPDTRVLYTSGYPGGATGRRNRLPPSAQLLGKPFTQQALLGKVREVLDAPPRAAS